MTVSAQTEAAAHDNFTNFISKICGASCHFAGLVDGVAVCFLLVEQRSWTSLSLLGSCSCRF